MKTKSTSLAMPLVPHYSFNNFKTLVEVYKNLQGRQVSNLQIKASFGELNGMVVDGQHVYLWKKEVATHDDVKAEFDGEHVFESFMIDAYERINPIDKGLTLEQLMEHKAIRLMMKR